METYTRSEQTKSIPQSEKIQNGDTRNHHNIPPARGVDQLNRFQGRLFPYPNTGTVQEIPQISCPGPVIPVQSPAIQTVHSTLGIYSDCKRSETDFFKGIRIHQYLDDTQELVQLCKNLGWQVNFEKSELDPKQVLDFVGYQFDLKSGRVRPTQERWQTLQQKILELLTR